MRFGHKQAVAGEKRLRSKKAREMLSSKTMATVSSRRMMRQNAHVWLSSESGGRAFASGMQHLFYSERTRISALPYREALFGREDTLVSFALRYNITTR